MNVSVSGYVLQVGCVSFDNDHTLVVRMTLIVLPLTPDHWTMGRTLPLPRPSVQGIGSGLEKDDLRETY